MSLTWASWAATDAGSVRTGNEDALVDRPADRIWAVADGAGGHEHGEVASAALAAMLDAIDAGRPDLVADIRAGVAAVHLGLCEQAADEQRAIGSPVTIASTLVVLLAREQHFACLWCGDSRAYLLRAGQFTQITRDHSLVQEMVDSGVLASEDAEHHPHANVLTRAIGAEAAKPELDKVIGEARPGDRFLLCSDGLFKALAAREIAALCDGADPARAMIDAALAVAARDNITAVVIEAATAG